MTGSVVSLRCLEGKGTSYVRVPSLGSAADQSAGGPLLGTAGGLGVGAAAAEDPLVTITEAGLAVEVEKEGDSSLASVSLPWEQGGRGGRPAFPQPGVP